MQRPGDPWFSLVRHDLDMISIDRGPPPWRQIRDDLRRRIQAGEWSGRLPSEKTLAQEYGVAVNTVRKAMAALREEGLIQTDKGWGSYVTGSEPPRNP
jgi:GntR family transcriptional regulator